MLTWIDFAIAAPALALIATVLWKAAEALRRRGVVVRPVSMMDATMSKVEKQFAKVPPKTPGASPVAEPGAEDQRGDQVSQHLVERPLPTHRSRRDGMLSGRHFRPNRSQAEATMAEGVRACRNRSWPAV